MKLDAQLSYGVLLEQQGVHNCLTEINSILLEQFGITKSLLANPGENGTDPVSRYFRFPVFFDLLKQLQTVNPEIYTDLFRLFVVVEQATKEQDKLRILKEQFRLPLNEEQKNILSELRSEVLPAKEVNDSKNYFSIGVTVLIILFLLMRMYLRMSR